MSVAPKPVPQKISTPVSKSKPLISQRPTTVASAERSQSQTMMSKVAISNVKVSSGYGRPATANPRSMGISAQRNPIKAPSKTLEPSNV